VICSSDDEVGGSSTYIEDVPSVLFSSFSVLFFLLEDFRRQLSA
jgi:hypothetical protein